MAVRVWALRTMLDGPLSRMHVRGAWCTELRHCKGSSDPLDTSNVKIFGSFRSEMASTCCAALLWLTNAQQPGTNFKLSLIHI